MTVASRVPNYQMPNLLTLASQGVGIKNALMQNRLMQNQNQQFQSTVAAGRDFQNAIGPDGQLSATALNANLRNDPNAAIAAPQMSQAAQNNYVTQLQANSQNIDNHIKNLTWASNKLGALLTPGATINTKTVAGIMADSMNETGASAKVAASTLLSFPPDSDPAAQRQWVEQHYAGAQHGIQQLLPAVGMANTGAQQVPVNTNPVAGPVGAMQGNPVNNTLSPGQAASPISYTGPQGQQITTTPGVIAANNYQLPGAPIVAGPTQQEAAANSATGTQSANMGAGITQAAATLAPQRALLQSIIAESSGANTGPISGQMAKLGGVLTQFGVKGLDQATAYQLTQKSTMQYVGQAMGSMGVPTDGKMMAMEMSTPNGSMTPEAVKAAGGMLMGGLDYKQAQAQAWAQYQAKNGPASYPQFQAQWNQNMPNAAVFQMQYLPKAQQQTYWKSLSEAQKQQFVNAHNFAASQGLLNGNQ